MSNMRRLLSKSTTASASVGPSGGGSVTITSDINIGGISAGQVFTSADSQTMWESLLLTYQPPLLNLLSSVAGGVREFGNIITAINLTATPSKGDNDITLLTISTSRDGLVANQFPIAPAGSPLVYNTLIADFGNIVNDMTITASVSDGTTTTNRNVSFDFVFPFYTGWVDDNTDIFTGITRAQLLALPAVDLNLKAKSNTTTITSPTNGQFMIGYPASYGDLSTIINQDGFDTITDYTKYVYNVVGLDGTIQSYNFYILTNDTTLSSYTNNFNY